MYQWFSSVCYTKEQWLLLFPTLTKDYTEAAIQFGHQLDSTRMVHRSQKNILIYFRICEKADTVI